MRLFITRHWLETLDAEELRRVLLKEASDHGLVVEGVAWVSDEAVYVPAQGEYHAEGLDERGIYGGKASDNGLGAVRPLDQADADA